MGNEHVLTIFKHVGTAIASLFGLLIAIVGIRKEKKALDDETGVGALSATETPVESKKSN